MWGKHIWLHSNCLPSCLFDCLSKRSIIYQAILNIAIIIEGSLEVKLPTIWTIWTERRRKEVRRSEKRKREKKEDAGARKGRKVAIHCFFPMICGSGGSTSQVGSLKRRVRSHLARWEIKSCSLLWREAHFQVNMLKAAHVWTSFGSCDVEKVRSTFPSQNVQNPPFTDHFWKLRYRKVPAVVARSTCPSQECKKLTGLDHSLTSRCRKSARQFGATHISKGKVSKIDRVRTGLEKRKTERFVAVSITTTNALQYTTLHHTTRHDTTRHYTKLHSITLRYHYN